MFISSYSVIEDSNYSTLSLHIVVQIWADNYTEFKIKFVLVCFSLLIIN